MAAGLRIALLPGAWPCGSRGGWRRDWRLETGDWRLEAGGWRLEAGGPTRPAEQDEDGASGANG